MSTKKWFAVMTICAFIGIISFFQINSYWADKNNFNTWWLVIGIAFILAAAYSLYRVSKNSGSKPDM